MSLLGYGVTAANTQAAADGQDIVALASTQTAPASGIPPLAVSAGLNLSCKPKAGADMVQNDYFAHVSPQGVSPWYFIRRSGYVYQSAGENLAMNFGTSAQIETAWMASPEHRANILDPSFTQVGIAERSVVYNGQRTNFVVEEFGQPAQ